MELRQRYNQCCCSPSFGFLEISSKRISDIWTSPLMHHNNERPSVGRQARLSGSSVLVSDAVDLAAVCGCGQRGGSSLARAEVKCGITRSMETAEITSKVRDTGKVCGRLKLHRSWWCPCLCRRQHPSVLSKV